MVAFIRSDLDFILEQIRIAEQNAAGTPLVDILPNAEVPWGLRTVSGINNNIANPQFGAADTTFPRLTTPTFLNDADGDTFDINGPAAGGLITNTNYGVAGNVADADPRIISNLIVDQTANNPAAVAAAAANGGATTVMSPGLDGVFGTADDRPVFEIPNITPDAGLSAPFNSWMTFFGQFFDHGLDLVTKSSTESVFIPLQPDDPLFKPGAPTNFMVLSRVTANAQNLTSPFVDQNQTYSSHPSHQVFLRAYAVGPDGKPHATGNLIENWNLGSDGRFGGTGADADTKIGGMATWAVVKAQARDLLGINLTDADVGRVPLLATDAYGNFIPDPVTGFAQIVLRADQVGGPLDPDGNGLASGTPAAPISASLAVSTGHQFLNDIAHAADPFNSQTGALLTPDADNIVNTGPVASGQYDNELLDTHFIAGDGRVNENIGLTAVHAVFHSEHNRLVEHTKDLVRAELAKGDTAFAANWVLPGTNLADGIQDSEWNGERLFQAAKFGTEMQYQHLVFEEFARTIQPQVDAFLAPSGYDVTIDPSIVAEFAHTVYRFGHSMLTETVDRYDTNFNVIGDSNPTTAGNQQMGLIAAFLNPLAYVESGSASGTFDAAAATGAIVRGVTRQAGNEIDEFVTEALRNNLVGLPLDLAAINIARGRDTGIPSLNEA